MIFLKRIYTYWVALVTVSGFLLLYPLYTLFIEVKPLRKYGNSINTIWGYWVFILSFLNYKYIHKAKLSRNQKYIFCPNHTSYLDIPSAQLMFSWKIKYVGKQSLCELPVFGYMFRNMHIGVNRESKVERYKTFLKCSEALDNGFSIVLFPEGTIPTENPNMIPFKDGAFRLAIEKKIPIVPVSMPYNWILLPDKKPYIANWHKLIIVVHEPIDTSDMTIDDVDRLKDMTYAIIDAELRKWNPNMKQNESN